MTTQAKIYVREYQANKQAGKLTETTGRTHKVEAVEGGFVIVASKAARVATIDLLAEAQQGKMPSPPDFSAKTHAPYRNKLATLIALAEARNLKALRAMQINPTSTSPKAMLRYRDMCILAIQASSKRGGSRGNA